MASATRILQLVVNEPGLRAKDIAARLGLSRREVNSVLFGELRREVVQDSRYRWWPKGGRPRESPQEEAPQQADTPLAQLCRYYLECLGHDYTKGISVFASSHYDLDYVELEELPVLEEADADCFDMDGAKRFLHKVRRDRYRLTLYLGYPVRLKRVRSHKGWEGFFVEPLFLFPYRFDLGDSYATPSLEDDIPTFNFKALESLITVDSGKVLDEAIQLSEELGLSSTVEDLPEIDEVFLRLPRARADWDWEEKIDPYSLSKEPPLSCIAEQGIYNRAVLVFGERSPFTAGLETELGKLANVDEQHYDATALGDWIRGETIEAPLPPEAALLEVLPLNSEQRQAVRHGLTNRLTVVTGPPGTGKSQVVTSLLVNAAWQGKKVLFASKNNKAVDVVETRVNALGPRPILLRMGRNEYQSRLAEHLVALLAATSSPEDAAEYERCLEAHQALRRRSDELDKALDAVVALRNKVDGLEQAVEHLREEFGEDGFQRFRSISVKRFSPVVKAFASALARANRNEQPLLTRLFWAFLRNGRFERLAAEANRLADVADTLNLDLPEHDVGDSTIGVWQQFGHALEAGLAAANHVQEYFAGLAALRSADSPETISQKRKQLVEDLAENCEGVWRCWLRLQPSRMSQEERRLLSEYTSLLQLITAANETGDRLGKKVFAQYYRLFPKVAGIISCWAVASLSARRIPFQPTFFDVLVIDEASQCDIASALPLLYRSKRAVIIGDPKQLRQISSLSEKQDGQILAKHGLIEGRATWAYSVNSLFDLACSLCRSEDIVSLRDHHRSHADIIRFSNEQFYEQRLRVATRYDRLRPVGDGQPAVRWVDVKGEVRRPAAGGAVNETEARAVVWELKRLVLEQRYRGTVGVVAPFKAHAIRIRDLVHQDDDLSRNLASADFLADTVHKFQGDERDLMVFSPVVSSETADSAIRFLQKNPNLFNVAVSRARSALVVVGDLQAALNSGVDYLASFASYVSNLGRERQPKEAVPFELGPEYPPVAHPERVSEWEHVLYRALYVEGLRPIPQRDVEQYTLDFALFGNGRGPDFDENGRKLDIEVDGERHHRNWDGELCRRDQIRNQRLMELGWDIMRFWVYQVRDELPLCVERVKKWAARH